MLKRFGLNHIRLQRLVMIHQATDELIQKNQDVTNNEIRLSQLNRCATEELVSSLFSVGKAAGSDEPDPAESRQTVLQRNPISLSFCCTQTG